jgi:hypothetical protein
MDRKAKGIALLLLRTVRVAAVAFVLVFGLALLLQFLTGRESVSNYIIHPALILAVWICARFLDGISFRELGLSPAPKAQRQFLFGGALAVLSTILMGLGMMLTGEWEPAGREILQTKPPKIPGTLLYCILIGFAEELLFRGYLISLWRKYGRMYSGIVVSALLFSSVHILNPSYGPAAFLAAFAIGLLYGYMVLAAGNLWMPIGHHIAWNFCQMLFLPPEGGEIAALVITAASFPVVIAYFHREKSGKMMEKSPHGGTSQKI